MTRLGTCDVLLYVVTRHPSYVLGAMRPMMLSTFLPLASLIMLMSPQWCGHSHVHTTGGRRRCVQPAGRVVVYSLGCCRRLEDELLHQNHRLMAMVIPFAQACKCLLCCGATRLAPAPCSGPLCMVQQLLFCPVCYSLTSFLSGELVRLP